MFTHTSKAVRAALSLAALGLCAPLLSACGGAGNAGLPSTGLAPATHAGAVQSQAVAPDKTLVFTTLDDDADLTFNQLLGINDAKEICGYFGSGASGHPNKGYTLAPPYAQTDYTNENFPGSAQTQVTAINNVGYTAGFWVDGSGNNFGFVEWKGVFTSYQDPNTGTGTVNQILGLNNDGEAVGFYTDGSGVNHGFKVKQGTKKYTEILPPGLTNVSATGINATGDITGFGTAGSGGVVGYLEKSGKFTEFSFPGSLNTTPLGVNAKDEMVGAYVDSGGAMHGFTLTKALTHAKFTAIDDPNGVGTTTINGLNDKGDLVGFYVDSLGNTDGMLITP